MYELTYNGISKLNIPNKFLHDLYRIEFIGLQFIIFIGNRICIIKFTVYIILYIYIYI